MDGRFEVVCFTAGGSRFAVEARQVQAMLEAPPLNAIAAETLLGLPTAEGGRRRWLHCGGLCLEVSEPVRLASLTVDHIHPLPPLLAARLTLPGARALAFDADGLLLVIEVPHREHQEGLVFLVMEP